jgi:hypothetical protein
MNQDLIDFGLRESSWSPEREAVIEFGEMELA